MSRKDIKDTLNEIHDAGAIKTEIYAEYRKRKLHVQLLEAQNDMRRGIKLAGIRHFFMPTT